MFVLLTQKSIFRKITIEKNVIQTINTKKRFYTQKACVKPCVIVVIY